MLVTGVQTCALPILEERDAKAQAVGSSVPWPFYPPRSCPPGTLRTGGRRPRPPADSQGSLFAMAIVLPSYVKPHPLGVDRLSCSARFLALS